MTRFDSDAERALLGAAILSREARDLAVDRLSSASFHDPRHGHLFHVLFELAAAGAPSDPVTVADALERNQLLELVGGTGFLIDLTEAAPTRDRASVERWVTIIEENHALRRLAAAAAEINEVANNGGRAADALAKAEAILGDIHRPSTDQVQNSAALVQEQHERLERVRNGELDEGISTGIPELDAILGGLVEDRFYVVAARPSMGKTSLAYHFVDSAAVVEGRPVLLVSLEMRGGEVIQRMTASRGKISSSHLEHAQLAPDESVRFEEACQALAAAPIYLLDTSETNVQTIRAAARKVQAAHGDLGLIVIDYIQLMSSQSRNGRTNDNRQQEVSEISRGCKLMARDLGVPVVALSQLSRAVELRQDKRPMLSDLRESGAIEQDADAVVFIYRDEFYNPATEDKGIAELLVAKNRQGVSGAVVKCRWVPEWVAFLPLDGPAPAVSRASNTQAPTGVPEEF